jgi:hypothetical protein
MGMVIHSFRILAALGPPAANVAAHAMKIAQGGRFHGGIPTKIVVTARSEATISAGGFLIVVSPWFVSSKAPLSGGFGFGQA